jgi:hypothetical protein
MPTDYRAHPIDMTLGKGRGRIRFADETGQMERVGYEYRGATARRVGDAKTLLYDPAGNNAEVVKDGAHNAFPSMVQLADKTLLVVYRAGSAHNSADGVIRLRTSTDLGRTWSAASVVYDDATYDARDGSVVRLADGRLMVNLFLYDATNLTALVDGVRVLTSSDRGATWGAPVTPDSAFTGWVACSGAVLELANGDLLLPVYGRNSGDARESTRVLRSADGGATWGGEVTVGDGVTNARRYQEPSLVLLSDGTIRCLMRSDTDDTQWSATSADGGLTWTAPALAFDGTGSSHQLLLADGRLLATFRSNGLNKPIGMRLSEDNGATWGENFTLENTNGVFSVYSEAVEIGAGMIAIVYGYERAADQLVSDLYLTYVSTVAGTTPLGDEAVGTLNADTLRVLGSQDTLLGHGIGQRFDTDSNRRRLLLCPRDDAPANASSRLVLAGTTDTNGTELGAIVFGRKGQTLPSVVFAIRRGSAANYGSVSFDVRGPNGYLRALAISEKGNILIGTEVENSRQTRGLTIQQGNVDDEILALKSSDVAHGMTDLTDTDTFLFLRKQSAASGGLLLRALSSASRALDIDAFGATDDTAKTTAARGYITLTAAKKNLTTSGAVGADANLLVLTNNFSTRFIVDAEGDVHADAAVTANAFDEWEDAELVRAFDLAVSRQGVIRTAFDEHLRYNRSDVERAGLATFDDETGSVFVNYMQLARLHTGAIWQMAQRLMRAEERLNLLPG